MNENMTWMQWMRPNGVEKLGTNGMRDGPGRVKHMSAESTIMHMWGMIMYLK